jgi:hypothetical protein
MSVRGDEKGVKGSGKCNHIGGSCLFDQTGAIVTANRKDEKGEAREGSGRGRMSTESEGSNEKRGRSWRGREVGMSARTGRFTFAHFSRLFRCQ